VEYLWKTAFDEMARLDLTCPEDCSFSFDISIPWKTIALVASGHGAPWKLRRENQELRPLSGLTAILL